MSRGKPVTRVDVLVVVLSFVAALAAVLYLCDVIADAQVCMDQGGIPDARLWAAQSCNQEAP